jgi:CRISPR-associated exonuclease Cas4
VSNNITGTLIWYYYICHREVWLIAHELNPDEDNPYLELGRIIQEDSYKREKKEISYGNMKIDLLKKQDGKVVIGEIKKSSRFERSAMMQLAFYLYNLKKDGIEAKGELLIPKEKKRIPVELDDGKEKELKRAFFDIENLLNREKPPEPKRISYCTNCAYREFCWA